MITSGTLAKSGKAYRLVYAQIPDTPVLAALHEYVIASLPAEEKTFMLPKPESFFEYHLQQGAGNAVISAYIEERLVAKSIILHPHESYAYRPLEGTPLPPQGLSSVSVMQGTSVHPEYRGNGLMQIMVKAWQKHAADHNRDYLIAEIETRNVYSLKNFLDEGLSIVSAGYDPLDNAPVSIGYKKRSKFAVATHLNIPTSDEIWCDVQDVERIQQLVAAGYKGISCDIKAGQVKYVKPADI
ncbi:MAG: hypothetical protein GC136_06565 [Alphaproteobacteria bacterium]|nr:hypothetical protein [Alphaproteobacteria bacterium]